MRRQLSVLALVAVAVWPAAGAAGEAAPRAAAEAAEASAVSEVSEGRVTGIGGVFFRARDPAALRAWYERHLGLGTAPFSSLSSVAGAVDFHWLEPTDPPRPALTVWAAFPEGTDYFGPGGQRGMLNYRVDDLDAVLARLRAAGVAVDEKVEEYDYGRFGWATDPEGHRIELWEPPAESGAAAEREAADRRAIEELHRRDAEAARRGDFATLRELMTDDAVVMPPGGGFQRGRAELDAASEAMESSFSEVEVLAYDLDFEEVLLFGDHAVEWGTITGAMRPHGGDGEPQRYAYKVMRILRRRPDGTWRVHRTIWNETPAASPADR